LEIADFENCFVFRISCFGFLKYYETEDQKSINQKSEGDQKRKSFSQTFRTESLQHPRNWKFQEKEKKGHSPFQN